VVGAPAALPLVVVVPQARLAQQVRRAQQARLAQQVRRAQRVRPAQQVRRAQQAQPARLVQLLTAELDQSPLILGTDR
jgi:hypothetical protein